MMLTEGRGTATRRFPEPGFLRGTPLTALRVEVHGVASVRLKQAMPSPGLRGADITPLKLQVEPGQPIGDIGEGAPANGVVLHKNVLDPSPALRPRFGYNVVLAALAIELDKIESAGRLVHGASMPRLARSAL